MKKLLIFPVLCVLMVCLVACEQNGPEGGKSKAPKGLEAVDMGLPSGIKWANFNIGSSSPEGPGFYYAWGETSPKEDYSEDTYKWYNATSESLTKYCTNNEYGNVDSKNMLDAEDDAASQNWGGKWRTPTVEEWRELRNNCIWTFTTVNSVDGVKITGPNGNSIFLPMAGSRNYTNLSGAGYSAYYWSSSLNEDYSKEAYCLYFGTDGGNYAYTESMYREGGHSVRPVCQ